MTDVFKKIFIYLLFFYLFTFNQNLLSQEKMIKKYYNNVFAGGKEKILSLKNDTKDIQIYYASINIILYENYSKINVKYYLKNKGKDVEISFAFPKLDAKIEKIIEKSKNKETKDLIIKGDYLNYSIKINREYADYQIQKDNENELKNPFKIGDTCCIIENKKQRYEEKIDSFYYTYSWHVTHLSIKNDEKKVISISYTTPHYYNTITINNPKTIPIIEDSALRYVSIKKESQDHYISEKIFSYLLNTSYSDNEKIIKKLVIILHANIIDQKYLEIFPKDYKKRGNKYIWKYKRLKANPVNNLLVKISPSYSPDTVNPLYFISTPPKITDGLNSFYEINKNKDSITLIYQKDDNNNKILVKAIRITPELYENNSQLKNINKPIKFEIEFSNNPNFENAIKFIKKTTTKKFIKSINKRASFTIYKGKVIKCKYIKIKILKTSHNDDIVRISDIQILE